MSFRVLRGSAPPDRREELLRNVAALLSMVSDTCSEELLAVYDSVMLRLAEMTALPVRAEAARRLADLRRAPPGIIRNLALDDIAVAQPLLIRSRLLTDNDLCGIAEIRGAAHRRAIAARPDLTAAVAAVLAERGDDSVRRILAGNVTADIPGAAYRRLLAQARADHDLQALIAAHPGLPDPVADALATFAEASVQSQLRRRRRQADRAPPAAPVDGERRMRAEALFAGHDFAGAEARIDAAIAEGTLDIAAIGALTAENRFAEAAVGLARLSGFPLAEVLDWFADCDTGMALVTVCALGGTEGDFRRLLAAGPWRFRMSARQRAAALRQFRALDAETARAILARRHDGDGRVA